MDPYRKFPDIFHVRCCEKKYATKLFSLVRYLFFLKNLIFINLLGPKELILLLPQYLPEYSLNIEISSLEVCHTRYYEKKRRRNNLFTWKIAVFFKTLCFQQPLRCYGNDLMTFDSKFQDTCWTLTKFIWGFSHSIIREKLVKYFFFTGSIAFFFNVLCFQQPPRF